MIVTIMYLNLGKKNDNDDMMLENDDMMLDNNELIYNENKALDFAIRESKGKNTPKQKIDIPKPKIQPPINIKEMEVKKEEKKKTKFIDTLTHRKLSRIQSSHKTIRSRIQ